MSNDISTMYTKEQNAKAGRRGWCGWQSEKETSISPDKYGDYVLRKRRHKKKRR